MERYEELREKVLSVEEDCVKFYSKENKAAGTRIRKAMQEIKNMAQDIRKEVQHKKNEG